jgi:hypothetical protein
MRWAFRRTTARAPLAGGPQRLPAADRLRPRRPALGQVAPTRPLACERPPSGEALAHRAGPPCRGALVWAQVSDRGRRLDFGRRSDAESSSGSALVLAFVAAGAAGTTTAEASGLLQEGALPSAPRLRCDPGCRAVWVRGAVHQPEHRPVLERRLPLRQDIRSVRGRPVRRRLPERQLLRPGAGDLPDGLHHRLPLIEPHRRLWLSGGVARRQRRRFAVAVPFWNPDAVHAR